VSLRQPAAEIDLALSAERSPKVRQWLIEAKLILAGAEHAV